MKNKRLIIRLTEQEHSFVKLKAASLGMSISKFVRTKILDSVRTDTSTVVKTHRNVRTSITNVEDARRKIFGKKK